MSIGCPITARPRTLPRRRANGSSGRRGFPAFALLLAMLFVTAAQAAEPEPLRTPGSKQQYRQVVAAWLKGDSAGVVALMPRRGKLRLDLMSPHVQGTYEKGQAQNTLKAYFAQISGVALKDVTDKRQRQPQGWMTRTYEYRYVPRGKDPSLTRLQILMKGDGRGGWTLNNITERKRPR